MDKNYPSVTQVLKPWSDFSRVDLDLLNMAAARGTEVHSICAAIVQGLWYEEPRPEVAGYVRSFRDWFESSISEVCWAESKLVDEVYRFTGTPDIVVILKGDSAPSLWDIKTPEPFPTCGVTRSPRIATWPARPAAWWSAWDVCVCPRTASPSSWTNTPGLPAVTSTSSWQL